MGGLREMVAVDVNAGHLAAWALTPGGNPAGSTVTIPLAQARAEGRERAGNRPSRGRCGLAPRWGLPDSQDYLMLSQ